MNVTFGVIALVFGAGAVIGKSVEFGGFKLPATGEKSVRIGLAILGLCSLAFALIPPSTSPTPGQQQAVSDGATTQPSSPTTVRSDAPAVVAATPNSTPPTAAIGAQLASYDTVLPDQHAVILGTSAPTSSQYSQGGSDGDLYVTNSGVGSYLDSPDKSTLLNLPGTGPPTYHLCSFNGISASVITSPTSGLSFCLQKSTLMLGITITSIDESISQISLHVIVWQGP